MTDAISVIGKVPDEAEQARRAEMGERGLEAEAQRRAIQTGTSSKVARNGIELELTEKSFEVAFESVPNGSFFRFDQLGGTIVIWINRSHRFFTDLHSGHGSSPSLRAALELLLYAIGFRALETSDDTRALYEHEVAEWSRTLQYTLSVAEKHGGSGHDERDLEDGMDQLIDLSAETAIQES